MKSVLHVFPIALLLAGAVIAVWRGFDTRPDRTNNRARGGGAKWKFWE